MDNPNPEIKQVKRDVLAADAPLEDTIYDLLRDIRDPEHPNTLEELSVIEKENISITEPDEYMKAIVRVQFVPTVPHCSMASLIGLSIRSKIQESDVLGEEYKLDVNVMEGTHDTGDEITKQLNDKERVAAALENQVLRGLVDDCLRGVAHLREVPQ
mmetsp:Transcript_20087/g.29179  ORF Transcript_20087/g.29179 Transcript_20087/m.29179 type:complete len:157 (-) Transcript_20087:98-568(-)